MKTLIRQSIPLLAHASDEEIQQRWNSYTQAAFGEAMSFESAMLHDFHAFTLAAQAQAAENWDEIREWWWKQVTEMGGHEGRAIESTGSNDSTLGINLK